MEREKIFWTAIVILVGVSAFFAGAYYNTLRTNAQEFANLELQLGILQDESSFLLKRDLQLIDDLDDLRNAVRDLELWMEAALEEGLTESREYSLEEIRKSKDDINSRISGIWSRIYDVEDNIRFLKCNLYNCTTCKFCWDDYDYYCPCCGMYLGP